MKTGQRAEHFSGSWGTSDKLLFNKATAYIPTSNIRKCSFLNAPSSL